MCIRDSLDRVVRNEDLNTLANGIELEDGFIQPDAISYVENDNKKEIGLEIHSGRNRIVRRMFESLGYRVVKLDRVYFAGLTKKNLPRGKWRFLSEKEISRLKMNAYE
jgi:23S rRNA pseudouridine2605 synthase